MHPAYSVIVFTTASGAGYGLLMLLAFGGLFGIVPPEKQLGFVAFPAALALVTVGLLSSTMHLGRPERAWRALSQWETSWLSREGVAALATFPPVLALAYGWAAHGQLWPLAALGTLVGAFATVVCTGMIYQSLPTIRAWSQPLTTPLYVAMSLATGGLLLTAALAVCGLPQRWVPWLALLPILAGWLMKVRYWAAVDVGGTLTTGNATGLGGKGATVRQLDSPHSQANYVMREMGFSVARRHAFRLRELAVTALFAVPAVNLLVALGTQGGSLTLMATAVAVLAGGIGVLLERWLFFAEAVHVVTLYYGRERA